jgi:hypothetical protein
MLPGWHAALFSFMDASGASTYIDFQLLYYLTLVLRRPHVLTSAWGPYFVCFRLSPDDIQTPWFSVLDLPSIPPPSFTRHRGVATGLLALG